MAEKERKEAKEIGISGSQLRDALLSASGASEAEIEALKKAGLPWLPPITCTPGICLITGGKTLPPEQPSQAQSVT